MAHGLSAVLPARRSDERAPALPLAAPAVTAAAGLLAALATTSTRGALAVVVALLVAATAVRPLFAVAASVVALSLPDTGWGAALGPTRDRLFVLLVLGAVAAARLAAPRRSVRAGSFALPVLAVVAVVGAQLLYTDFPVPVLRRLTEVLLAALCGYVVLAGTRARTGSLPLGGALVVFAGVQALLGIAQFAAARPLLMGSALPPESLREATNIEGYFRGLGTFYHANSLALLLCLTLPVALQRAERHRSAALGWAPVALLVLGVLTTLSRAGVAVMAVVLLAHVLRRSRNLGRTIRSLLVVGVLGAGLLAVPVFGDAAARFTNGSVAARDQGSGLARNANMHAALRGFEERPLLGFGWGTSANVGASLGGYRSLGAHNAYLDVLQGGGLLLAVPFGWLVLRWLGLMRGLARRRDVLALYGVLVPLYALFETLTQGLFLVLLFAVSGLALGTQAAPEPTPDTVPDPTTSPIPTRRQPVLLRK